MIHPDVSPKARMMPQFKLVSAVVVFAIVTGITCGVTIASREQWLPYWSPSQAAATSTTGHANSPAGEAGHDHGHAGEHGHEHDTDSHETSIALSEQARANLGLITGIVELTEYTRTLDVPGQVVEQYGHCERLISTRIPGVVTRIHVYPGQSVRPGDPLVDLSPTGELLTSAQIGLLKTLQEIELVETELKRLSPLVENGTIPTRTKLEKEYTLQRYESQKLIQIQELLVRGLSPTQINEMVVQKTLLREFTLRVPGKPDSEVNLGDQSATTIIPASLISLHETTEADDHAELLYTVEKLSVVPGKLVEPGDELCDLALHTELYLEGRAFESESELINQVVQQQRPIVARFEAESGAPYQREKLRIQSVDNFLDPVSRTLRFLIPIKNEILSDTPPENGVSYRSWRFKPGQKVQLTLPLEYLAEQLVVPQAAVVIEGPEAFVFRVNGKLLERVPVIIDHRDPKLAVLRNDGSIYPGDEIALNEAYQINLALRKQQGSGVDPHAGHSH